MDFRIRDVTVHLMSGSENDDQAKEQGPPCTMMSGEPEKCRGVSHPGPCPAKTQKPKQDPPGNPRDGGEERRGLAFLQARLRESLAPPV